MTPAAEFSESGVSVAPSLKSGVNSPLEVLADVEAQELEAGHFHLLSPYFQWLKLLDAQQSAKVHLCVLVHLAVLK